MERRLSWMIWWAVAVHFLWGVQLLWNGDALGATPIASVARYVPDRDMLATFLLLASVMSVTSLVFFNGMAWQHVLLLIPQQFLLVLSAVGGVEASIGQHYADGVIRPFGFIFADQFPGVAAAIMHTLAIVELNMRHQRR